MLNFIFNSILKMSLTSSYVIIFVILIRCCIQKLPKIYSYALWSVVLFRLISPFSFKSNLSLVPNFQESFSNNITTQNITNTTSIFSIIWFIGVILILGFSLISLLKLKSKLKDNTHLFENIFQSKSIDTAFVLGIFSPKIYLPENISKSQQEFILLHEQTHIKRFDYIFCLIAYFSLILHWFNPLVWLAFHLANMDMEMSCDEVVISKLGCKKEYSNSILALAVGTKKSKFTLAFSEGNSGDTKQRINNILNYKKPALWIALICLLSIAFFIFGLSSDNNNHVISESSDYQEIQQWDSISDYQVFDIDENSDYVISESSDYQVFNIDENSDYKEIQRWDSISNYETPLS